MSLTMFDPARWFGSDPVSRTRRFVGLFNLRDHAALGRLVSDDFLYLDTAETPVRGREDFVAALQELHRQAPDLKIEADEIFKNDGESFVKGRLQSADKNYCSESLWRLQFKSDKISQIQAFREKNAVSVPKLTAHLRRSSDAA